MAVAGRKVRIAELGTVRVALCASASAAALGLEMEQQNGSFVVTSVSGLAMNTAKVSEGFEVVGVDFGEGMRLPASPGELSVVIEKGCTVEVELRRPEPPIPFHCAARKGIHKQTRVKMNAGQLEWLQANVFHGGEARMHSAPACIAMKAAFAQQIRTDTMTPMWLSKDQISTWRAAQFKDEKNRRRQGRKAANGRGTGVADAVPSAGAATVPPPSKKIKGGQEGGGSKATKAAAAAVRTEKGKKEQAKTTKTTKKAAAPGANNGKKGSKKYGSKGGK